MEGVYSFEQRRIAYLKTKAGCADKVAMVLATLPALAVVFPLILVSDIVIIVKIIATVIGIFLSGFVYGKIQKPIFKHYYAKNLKGS